LVAFFPFPEPPPIQRVQESWSDPPTTCTFGGPTRVVPGPLDFDLTPDPDVYPEGIPRPLKVQPVTVIPIATAVCPSDPWCTYKHHRLCRLTDCAWSRQECSQFSGCPGEPDEWRPWTVDQSTTSAGAGAFDSPTPQVAKPIADRVLQSILRNPTRGKVSVSSAY